MGTRSFLNMSKHEMNCDLIFIISYFVQNKSLEMYIIEIRYIILTIQSGLIQISIKLGFKN